MYTNTQKQAKTNMYTNTQKKDKTNICTQKQAKTNVPGFFGKFSGAPTAFQSDRLSTKNVTFPHKAFKGVLNPQNRQFNHNNIFPKHNH